MLRLLPVFMLMMMLLPASAGNLGDSPEHARTTDEILAALEPTKGFGTIQSVRYECRGRRLFVAWFDPFSGRAACYAFAYSYDEKTGQWKRFMSTLVEGTHDLSPELPCKGDILRLRAFDGRVAFEQDLP